MIEELLKYKYDNPIIYRMNLYKEVKTVNIVSRYLHNVTFEYGMSALYFYFHKRNDRIPERHVPFRKKHVLSCSPFPYGKVNMCNYIEKEKARSSDSPMSLLLRMIECSI